MFIYYLNLASFSFYVIVKIVNRLKYDEAKILLTVLAPTGIEQKLKNFLPLFTVYIHQSDHQLLSKCKREREQKFFLFSQDSVDGADTLNYITALL